MKRSISPRTCDLDGSLRTFDLVSDRPPARQVAHTPARAPGGTPPTVSSALPAAPSGEKAGGGWIRGVTHTVVAALVLWAPAALQGQTVPAPADVLGYEIGERFTPTSGVQRYMEALAEASELVTVDTYGETIEGRPLVQALIARPDYRDRMEEILAANRELMDPETSEERAREIAATNPAVVYFTYAVHGNESSSPEAAMWTAWDLASGAQEVAGVLDSVVVVMDPVANPDGRDRYVNFYRSAAQLRDTPDTRIRERREPWPGGRFNHYLFDLNRDWAWLSQQETRDRLVRFHRYNPQVHVDFHEMGYRSSYFFFPAAEPINDIFPDHILEWGERFGHGNARAMDSQGLLYYTGQNFDLFYPGYGDSWPSLVGAVGMTYEQGGGGFGGRTVERPDGTILTLRDRALGHRTTGNATLRTTAQGKTDLLLGFAGFHREIDEGLDDTYLVPGSDPSRARALVRLLRMHDIEVEELEEEMGAGIEPHPGYQARSQLPAGTYRVRARQPRGRLAGALLRPDNLLEGTSSYDITAWALPYAYGVEAHSSGQPLGGEWRPVDTVEAEGGAGLPARGNYGYLLPPSFSNARALVDFLEEGGRAYAMADTFSLGETHYPRGTLFFPQGRNEELDQRLETSGLAAMVTPIETGFVDTGPDLGTNDQAALALPRLALLGGEGTSATGFGAHWHFLEQVLDLPFHILNVSNVSSTDLSDYDVIVAPPGTSAGGLGDGGVDRLGDWVRAGGTLVATGSASRSLGGTLAEIERRTTVDDEEEDRDERLQQALRSREEREMESWLERVPGTILRGVLDPDHPLAFGAAAGQHDDALFVLSTGNAFEPTEDFESAIYFPEGLARISGVISESNLERLDRSTWLADRRLGSGRVILFADDPLFRMFWYSGWQLYTNAILVAPRF